MRIFVVAFSETLESLAEAIIAELGVESYAAAEEFVPDGVQDPYGAVDKSDAIVWIVEPALNDHLGLADYNYFFADTVMQRAVRIGKPVLYYFCRASEDMRPAPAILQYVTRRPWESLEELKTKLHSDLSDLISGVLPLKQLQNAPSIFISYAHKDKRFARKLGIDLRKAGAKVWVDEGEIKVGDSLITTIQQGIDQTAYFGIILSPNAMASSWVQRELDIALNHEINGRRVKVLPILYKTCELPSFLKGKLYADFTGNYKTALQQVLKSLGITVLQS